MDIEGPNEVDHNLETVRVLHQTVVSLRAALEQSKNELHKLREQVETEVSTKSLNRTVECLSVENHVLRQKIIDGKLSTMDDSDDTCDNRTDDGNNESDVDDVFEDETPEINGIQDVNKDETKEIQKFSKGDSEESEEVDDIELIFTTDDTKECHVNSEDLVSIAESENWKHKFDEKFLQNLKQTWSHSVLVETDISKCGVIDENEPPTQYARRNTLPTPLPYKPIIHREILGGSRLISSDSKPGVKFSVRSPKTVRPILAEKNIDKQESEAQTDITALPVQWRSESFLAHNKGNQNFTTLPSKFQVPFGQLRKQSLRLSEKTQEARRVLLSDINFTSMVPELSRSADHLCNEASSLLCKYPRAFSYMKNPDMAYSGSKSGWSPCECGLRRPSWDYGGSSFSITPSEITDVTRRRHSMRPSLLSLDVPWSGGHPQRPVWASMPSSPTHSQKSRSVPLSCSYILRSNHHSEVNCYNSSRHYRPRLQNRNKVKFLDSKLTRHHPGTSLPDLRADTTDSNEDSTDSLIDESETYLRRSIDSILTGEDPVCVRKNRHPRSHSQPERIYSNGFGPAKRAQPFLARTPSDIRINYWVKVISTDGKLVVGKVKYVGPLPGSLETFVGLVLPLGEGGNCTGTYSGTRYFVCDSDCGLFVPFKKVVMVWSG